MQRQVGRPEGRRSFRDLLKRLDEEMPEEQPSPGPRSLEDQAAMARCARAASSSDAVVAVDGTEPVLQGTSHNQRLLGIGNSFQRQVASTVWKYQASSKNEQKSVRSDFHRVFTQHRSTGSLTSEAQGSERGRKSLAIRLQEGACFLVVFTGYLIGVLLSTLLRLITLGRHKAILLCVKRTYDETPSKMTVSWMTYTEQGKFRATEEGTAKVLQTNCNLLVLMQHVPSGAFYTLQMALPCWLQSLDRTTAENTFKSQQRILQLIPGLEDFGALCKFNIQLVATDKYSANLKAERSMCPTGLNSANSHYTCDVHKTHSCQAKTMSMVEGHVSALIAAALSCAEAGSVRGLQEAMNRVLKEKVHVCFGSPPEDEFTASYRAAVFDAFLPIQQVRDDVDEDLGKLQSLALQRRRQRAVITFFLHGDLQDHDEIWFRTQVWGLEVEQVLALMRRYLVPLLLPRRPPVFSRTRWDGFDDAVRYYGLVDACHGLLRPTLLDFLAVSPTESALPAGTAVLQDQGQAPGNQDQDQDDQEAEQVRKQMDAVSGNVDWTDLKLRMKQKVVAWLGQPVFPILILINIAAGALSHLLRRLLAAGSHKWEDFQRTKVANSEPRTFPVLQAARGVDLDTYRADLNKAFHEQVVLLPRDVHVRQYQVLLFRMLSRNFCATEFHLGTSWSSYPVRLFASLDGRHHVLEDPDCMLCPLSKLVVMEYPTAEALNSVEAQSVLRALASLFSLHIADVEAKHASTRRITTVRGVQTTRPALCLVSGDWVCRSNVVRRLKYGLSKPAAQPDEPKADAEQNPANPQRRNAWNAFLSDACSFSFSKDDQGRAALRQRYKELTEEEQQRYQQMADVAFCARQRGLPGYSNARAGAAGASSSALAVQAQAEQAVDVVGHAAYELLRAEVDGSLALAREEHRKHTDSSREWLQTFQTARDEYEQEDEALCESLSCHPALLQHYMPALNGMLSADVHVPADKIGEAW